ncbi:hypothetical protein RI367_008264 [Sorochytrium milnesiophthora]
MAARAPSQAQTRSKVASTSSLSAKRAASTSNTSLQPKRGNTQVKSAVAQAPPGASMKMVTRARRACEAAISSHKMPDPAPYVALDAHISVVLRTRPLLQDELDRDCFAGIKVSNPNTFIFKPAGGAVCNTSLEVHRFDNVDASFGPQASSEEVYAAAVSPLLPLVLGGGLAAIFAFGQTGSGKTFTMTALQYALQNDLFPTIADEFVITLSYFEIFGDDVFDLLNERAPLRVRSTPSGFTMVQGAKQLRVQTASEFCNAIERGAEYRQARTTFKNTNSSRTHAVCAIHFTSKRDGPSPQELELAQQDLPEGVVVIGRTLLIIDLAGSERNSDQTHHDAVRIKEAQVTNTSLMTLKECIRARHLRSLNSGKHIHIPFRASALTMVLKDALDPDSSLTSRTTVIGHLSPSITESQHTLNTARYISALKASSLSHSTNDFTTKKVNQVRKRDDVVHPSKWSYQELSRKFSIWSKGSINLSKIVPPPDTSEASHSSPLDRFLEGGGADSLGAMPVWMQVYQFPRNAWVQACAAHGVTKQTAEQTWEAYQKHVAASRVSKQLQEEGVDILLLN